MEAKLPKLSSVFIVIIVLKNATHLVLSPKFIYYVYCLSFLKVRLDSLDCFHAILFIQQH